MKNFLKRDSSIQPSATGIKFLQKLFPQFDNFISSKIKRYVVFSWSYVIFIGQSTKMSENWIEILDILFLEHQNVRKWPSTKMPENGYENVRKFGVMSTHQNISENFIIFEIWNFDRAYVIFYEVMSFLLSQRWNAYLKILISRKKDLFSRKISSKIQKFWCISLWNG